MTNLIMLRQTLGLKRSQVAEALEVNLRTLGAWERGEFKPNAKIVKKFAEFYGVDEEFILGDTGNPNVLIGNSNIITSISNNSSAVVNGHRAASLPELEAELLRIFMPLPTMLKIEAIQVVCEITKKAPVKEPKAD